MLTNIILTVVLAFPFENLSHDRSLDWIGEGVSELVIERLRSNENLIVFPREERLAAYEKLGIPEMTMVSRATAMKLGWDAGADNIIVGRFSGTPENFRIVARMVDLASGSAEEIEVAGRLEDVIPAADTLSWRILKKLVPGTATPESGFTSRPPAPPGAFENYIRGLLTSDPQKRVDLFQTALRLHPPYRAAMYQLGRTLHSERNFKASSDWLDKVNGGPDRRQAQFLAGLNLFYSGEHAAAASIFGHLPPTYDVLINLGAALLHKGDHAGAILAWRRASDLDPLSSDAFFNMGYASVIRGDYQTAIANLQESLTLRGRDSEALFLLGRAYERSGKAQEAQRALAQSARLSQRVERWLNQPLPKLDRLRSSATFNRRDDIWTGERLARRAKAQDIGSWLEQIQTRIDAHQYGEAIRELQDVLRIHPNSGEAQALFEEVHTRRNRQ